MTITKTFSAVIIDHEKLSDINKVIFKYAESARESSSYIIFNVKPINLTDITNDLTFFKLSAENEKKLNNKLKELIDELNSLNTDYGIRDEETKEILSTIKAVGAWNIKFDNIKIIPKGTYAKIDSLKNIKTELGYSIGYKPPFRPIESKEIENINIKDEIIYIFSRTKENQLKLKDSLSEKIMEINPDFILEYETFL